MKTLDLNQMERIEGGATNRSNHVAGGLLCVAGIGAVAVSATATVLTGGALGIGLLWSMGAAAASCTVWANGQGR